MNPEKVKLAIAPIGWSNDDLPELGGENTFEQCISEMALAGFTGSEVGNKYPKDIAVLKHKLELRKMQICNCWFSSLLTSHPYEETIKAFEKQLDFLYEMGARVIGISEQGNSIQGKPVPVLEQKPVYTEDEWKTIYKGFNEMGRIAKDKGMSMTVHHHMGTGVQTLAEIDRLMENTDPSLVYLLFDSGHLFFADEDPVAVLKKYVGRTRHVHLKDVRPDVLKRVKEEKMSFLDGVRAGVFTVPGDGCIDFPAIFNILDQAGYEGWMVVEAEQDPAIANPFEYALKARQYIRDTTGL